MNIVLYSFWWLSAGGKNIFANSKMSFFAKTVLLVLLSLNKCLLAYDKGKNTFLCICHFMIFSRINKKLNHNVFYNLSSLVSFDT